MWTSSPKTMTDTQDASTSTPGSKGWGNGWTRRGTSTPTARSISGTGSMWAPWTAQIWRAVNTVCCRLIMFHQVLPTVSGRDLEKTAWWDNVLFPCINPEIYCIIQAFSKRFNTIAIWSRMLCIIRWILIGCPCLRRPNNVACHCPMATIADTVADSHLQHFLKKIYSFGCSQ